jgi:hypothetical protein
LILPLKWAAVILLCGKDLLGEKDLRRFGIVVLEAFVPLRGAERKCVSRGMALPRHCEPRPTRSVVRQRNNPEAASKARIASSQRLLAMTATMPLSRNPPRQFDRRTGDFGSLC